jgi:methanogenic corrinoid protein MtbC1
MTTKEKLVEAMKSGDAAASVELAQKILAERVPAAEVVEALIVAIRLVGEQFERFEIFLPEMMLSSNAMVEILKVLEPRLKEESPLANISSGKVVMASVKGDTHEIGKNIVMTLLKANRFNVVDLGADVDSLEIVKTAEREKADIIGLSALMTTTMLGQKEVVDILKDMKLREKFKVIIGGAPTNEEWAERIGADGWAGDAAGAVTLAEKLIKAKGAN